MNAGRTYPVVELQRGAGTDPNGHWLLGDRPLEHCLANWQVDVRVDGYHRLPLGGKKERTVINTR